MIVCPASALTVGDDTEDQFGNAVLVRSWILLCVVDCNGNDVPEMYHDMIDNEDLSSGKVYVLSFVISLGALQMARMQAS